MSTWCNSYSIASACRQPVSRVPDVGEAQASYDVAMKLHAVDVAETTSKEAAARQFGVDSMEFIWRGRYQREINAGPYKRRVNLTPKKINAPGMSMYMYIMTCVRFVLQLSCTLHA